MTADTNPTSTALYLDVVLLLETSVGDTSLRKWCQKLYFPEDGGFVDYYLKLLAETLLLSIA